MTLPARSIRTRIQSLSVDIRLRALRKPSTLQPLRRPGKTNVDAPSDKAEVTDLPARRRSSPCQSLPLVIVV